VVHSYIPMHAAGWDIWVNHCVLNSTHMLPLIFLLAIAHAMNCFLCGMLCPWMHWHIPSIPNIISCPPDTIPQGGRPAVKGIPHVVWAAPTHDSSAAHERLCTSQDSPACGACISVDSKTKIHCKSCEDLWVNSYESMKSPMNAFNYFCLELHNVPLKTWIPAASATPPRFSSSKSATRGVGITSSFESSSIMLTNLH